MTTDRDYWLDLFTGTTWEEFVAAGANISGFREGRWKTVQRIKVGDYLLCYVTGISRLIGILEVTSEAFRDETPIWNDAAFPCRLKVKPVITLTFETAVPIQDLRETLSIFQNLKNPHAWNGRLRGSPAKWKRSDGEVIFEALLDAQNHADPRPVDERKLRRKPAVLAPTDGGVSVPGDNYEEVSEHVQDSVAEATAHTEIQYLLLRLGADMGFDVWVARNDRNRLWKGRPLSELFKFKESLPLQFDDATTKTIEYIDVLWLRGSAIEAAFEIESTTSIYSELLRMSDLVAMQPNINIPLYLVAPDERRDKVFQEVNRPTFARLSTPLSDVCQYISFVTLKDKIEEVGPYIRFMKPAFLDELAEICEWGEV